MKRILVLGLATLALSGGAAGAIQPNDPVWAEQLGVRQIGLPQVWETTTGDPGVIIATVDTGANLIPDLEGALVPGYDFVDNDFESEDTHNHGTRVASVIAARGNNGIGMAGHCWGCRVMPIRVSSNGSASPGRIAVGIRYAVDRGARIINVSLSHSGSPDGDEAAAVRYAIERGVIVVASAGNAGTEALQYPGAYPGVVAVGGTDDLDDLYFWSSRGSWVSLTAPGCQMVEDASTPPGTICGTSFTPAVVSAVAGLILSRNPSLSASQVVTAMVATARPVKGVAYGRIDPVAAFRWLGLPIGAATVAEQPPAATPPVTVAQGAAARARPAVHAADPLRDRHVQAGVPLDVQGRTWTVRDAAADAARRPVLAGAQLGERGRDSRARVQEPDQPLRPRRCRPVHRGGAVPRCPDSAVLARHHRDVSP